MITTARIDIDSLVETRLPMFSTSAMRVATLAQDINASTRAIADTIGYDPALAASVLRAANSPLYNAERDVTALPVAVSTLGNDAIYHLMMLHASAVAFGTRRTKTEMILWEHSLAVGVTAREVSRALGMRGVEESFLCGLLHDIGKLLLLNHDAEGYEAVQRCDSESQLLDREQAAYGYTHAQVGALVARRWNLPEQVSHVIYYHHQPSDGASAMLTARVVDVADSLVNCAGIGMRDESGRDLSHDESVIAFDLTAEQLDDLWQKSARKFEEAKSMVC